MRKAEMAESPDAGGQHRRLRSGEATAWEELYRAMYPSMTSYARRRLPEGEARDAVSETMARALAHRDRLPPLPSAPEPWVFGILRHVVQDAQRRSYRGLRLRQRTPAVSTDWAQAGDDLESDEERRHMREAFGRLSARDQEVLELRVVAGLSAEETGRIMGMREGAVRNAQYRALRRLRKIVEARPTGEER
jgi:RNA polymerase sigma-70 factor (ECF subfamily)